MKDISKTYSKLKKKDIDGISELLVIIYCPLLKTITQHLESLIFYGIAKIFIDPVGLWRKLGKRGLWFLR